MKSGRFLTLAMWMMAGIFCVTPAEAQQKFFGCVWRNSWTHPDCTTVKFNELFNQVAPEGAGKWNNVEKTRDTYYWTTLDAMYSWAEQHGVPIKEHALVWWDGSANGTPEWARQLPDAEFRAELEQWIRDWATRYASRTEWIDVVNEPIRAGHQRKNALGGDGATGYDWVVWCFEKARQYAPNCKLMLNDYSMLEYDVDRYVRLANILKTRGLLDGIGEQGHFLEWCPDMVTANDHLQQMVDVGVPLHISELTMAEPDDQKQLELYQKWIPLFWENPAIVGITLWGYYQPIIYSANFGTHIIRTDGSERPSLTWLRGYLATHPGGTSQIPDAPQLVSPVNARTSIPTSPALSWNASLGATRYHVQMSTNSSFTAMVSEDSTLAATGKTVNNLGVNTTYHWRVRARNAAGVGSWSNIWTFTTVSAAPATPTLLSPPEGSTDQGVSPVLTWTASPGVEYYHVQLSTNSDFSTLVKQDSLLTSTTTLMNGLDGNSTYHWRVRAQNAVGDGAWTPGWNFTTRDSERGSINCGGPASGTFFADQYWLGGAVSTATGTVNTSGVASAAPADIYLSERYGNLTYTIPGLAAGVAYRIALHFAEVYWNSPGQRAFHVDVNGTRALSNYDIISTAGGAFRAVVEVCSGVANGSGQIVIAFTTVTDNAKINGIQWSPAATPVDGSPRISLGPVQQASRVFCRYNPAQRELAINVPGDKISEVQLHDVKGVTVALRKASGAVRLSLPAVAWGTYFVSIDGVETVFRIVVR